MCMYYHIQGHLFPWRVRVFLKVRITTFWPNACTSLCKCMCSFRISACTSIFRGVCSLGVFACFLKQALPLLGLTHVLLRISACTPYICACTSLYMFMYFFVYMHVAFDVSMQSFGVVSIACVVPAHLFLSVGVCLLGLGRMFFVV